MDRMVVTIAGVTLPGVEAFDVSIARTFTDEIKRTVAGAVKKFPLSYLTIGISCSAIMEVRAATALQYALLSANTVTMSGQNNKYNVSGTVSATTPPELERVKDAYDDMVRIKITLVSVSPPTIAVNPSGSGKIVITMPAM